MFSISQKHDGHGVLGLWGSDSSLMWCREEQQLTQMHTSARCKKWASVSKVFSLTRTCMKCCFSTIMEGLTPVPRIKKCRTCWMVLLHPPCRPSSTPSDFHLFTPLEDALHRRKFESDDHVVSAIRTWLSIGQGMVLVGHTCPHSTLVQSYRTACRVHRKLGYINQGSINITHYFQDCWINSWWKKMWGITFWASLV